MPRPSSAALTLAAVVTLSGCGGGVGAVRGSHSEPGQGSTTSVALQQPGKAVVVPRTQARAAPVPLTALAAAHPPPAVELRPADAGGLPAAGGPGPIVALGDSLTYGYGTGAGSSPTGPPPAHSYPWYLARQLNLPVINAGVSGTTAYGVLDSTWAADTTRPPSLRLPALLAMHPRLMIVGFGSNEAIRGWPIRETAHDLDLLLGRISAAQVPVVLVGTHVDCYVLPCEPAPGYVRQRYTEDWDAALGWLATKYSAPLAVNVEDGFTPNDFTDWIHPSSQGYARIAQRVAPAVLRALAGDRAPSPASTPTPTGTTAPRPPAAPPTAGQDHAPATEPGRRDPPPPQSIWEGRWGGRSSLRLPLLEILGRGVAAVLDAPGTWR
jgi:acyl-CoA thioesterase I